jgi:transcription antitermination factor NusG
MREWRSLPRVSCRDRQAYLSANISVWGSTMLGCNLGEVSDSWYVVHCKPLKESYAEWVLRQRLDIVTYLPTVISRVRGVAREVPFFPGYLFVNVDLQDVPLSSINQTPGVLRLVSFSGEALPVPKVVISTIKERLEALNGDGGLPAHSFHIGDTLVLKSGPFRGLQAVFMGPMTPSARVKVLIEFLGRLNEVKVEVENLTQPHRLEPKRERRTRGKGRRIYSEAGV